MRPPLLMKPNPARRPKTVPRGHNRRRRRCARRLCTACARTRADWGEATGVDGLLRARIRTQKYPFGPANMAMTELLISGLQVQFLHGVLVLSCGDVGTSVNGTGEGIAFGER